MPESSKDGKDKGNEIPDLHNHNKIWAWDDSVVAKMRLKNS